MIKKINKIDTIFIVALLSGLLIHIYFLFSSPFSYDESYYAVVPFRLMNGESLIKDIWHLTQFSSLFNALPVYVYVHIKGSTEGLIIFLRCIYLLLHTATSIIIYRSFRKYGNWAIVASMMFHFHITYNIQAISYQSMLVISLLLMLLCLYSIYQKPSTKVYIFTGIFYGICCICNPLLCGVFLLYLFSCAFWKRREEFINFIFKIKNRFKSKSGKKLTKKQKKEEKQQEIELFYKSNAYTCFFTKDAIIKIACGVVIVAILAVAFFFLTGGTIDSVFKNAENLLESSEYDIVSKSFLQKLLSTFEYFSAANLGMPWIIPLLFLALLFDKNKMLNTHRFAYLLVAIIWGFILAVGIIKVGTVQAYCFSFPFFVVSTLIYILTKNKNKVLFNCIYLPAVFVAILQYLAANTLLGALGMVFAVNNIVGVLFAKDLWDEISCASQDEAKASKNKDYSSVRKIIIIGICVQLLFYGTFYYLVNNEGTGPHKTTSGPYKGLYMSQTEYDSYNKTIDDLDYIKSITNEDDPVLFIAYKNWMYLYVDRPIATYSTWYTSTPNIEQLEEYYEQHPNKKPKYIYKTISDTQIIDEMFECTQEELSNGTLYTVIDYKF